ncbi:MAG: hypothetical protein WA989_00880 [Henriciella sp.]|uniref:hypothetical protein n=1 Tax=Henriciella sp. TaxID=1968823 RepID=UPI003C708239
MRSLVTLAGLTVVTGFGAQAEPCTATTFSSAHGAAYMEAETALVDDSEPEAALSVTEALWSSNLNCFERASVRKLRAAALVELDEYKSAIALLKPLVSDLSESRADRARTAHTIGQLYLASGDQTSAATYLELSEKLSAPE